MCLCLFWLKCRCKIFTQNEIDSGNKHVIDDCGSQSQGELPSTRLGKDEDTKMPTISRAPSKQEQLNNILSIIDSNSVKHLGKEKNNLMKPSHKSHPRRAQTTKIPRITRASRRNTGS